MPGRRSSSRRSMGHAPLPRSAAMRRSSRRSGGTTRSRGARLRFRIATGRTAPEDRRVQQHHEFSRITGERMPKNDKPNFLIIWGDDIGYWNISHYSKGMMGYQTPNIDRIAQEGAT